MILMNVNKHDTKLNTISEVIESILSCSDGKYVEEIYAKEGSFRNGLFSNWVGLMIELTPEFENKSLYDVIDEQEEKCNSFTLVISTEPNTVERGNGTVLWIKEA